MPPRQHLAPAAALTGALSLALVLAGCQKASDNAASADSGADSAVTAPALPATLPMTNAAPPPTALAPAPAALPHTQPLRAVRVADPRSAYAYADQASSFSQSLGEAPPDYSFDYDDVQPWAWQGYDGSRVFVEPVSGGYRTYYYRPGAERPFFIRDPDYAYGYDGDQLAAVYGPDGALIPYDSYGPQQNYAAAYLWRAIRLYEASRERQAVSAAAWMARQNAIIAAREQWAADRERQADWAAYHAQEAAQESRYWAQEAERRAVDQQRFAQWRAQDFRTPPPPRAIPPRWQQASWAQDNARYAPVAAAVAGGAAAAMLVRHAPVAPQPFMAPQPVAQPSRPVPPAPRPGWQGRAVHMPPPFWQQQQRMGHPPAFHPQAPAQQHAFSMPHPPAMAHQRPSAPPPEAHTQPPAFWRATHEHAPWKGRQHNPAFNGDRHAAPPPAVIPYPPVPRPPMHDRAMPAPMPPPAPHAPAPPPHPAPAAMPHHENAGQSGHEPPKGGEHHGHP